VRESAERRERYARNEALFREVNERIRTLAEQWVRTSDPVEFLCECANPACAEGILVGLDDYESVRAHPTRFFVSPGHLDLEVERVVLERAEFWVVEKHGAAGVTAAELDPRA
jgi:hypothetical protein